MTDSININTRKNKIPLISLGTWKSPLGKTGAAVRVALECGYRGFDCANDYGNEAEIGDALKKAFEDGIVKREELFIQCKLWNTNHRPEHVKPDLQATLNDLKLDYVDSFVIHWPQACPSNKQLSLNKDGPRAGPASEGTMFPLQENGLYCSDNESHYVETYHEMEKLIDEGLCKSIGLSNFNSRQVREILDNVKKHKPTVLQNESHPYLASKDLRDLCRINNIVFQAYSPLGSFDRPWAKSGSLTSGPPPTGTELLDDGCLSTIAKRLKKSTAQVVLRWHVQMGGTVAVKSVTPARIQSNIDVFNFELSENDMNEIANLNIGWRHLLWAETSLHPDYPFKDDLPHDYVVSPAPSNTGKSGQ